LNFPNFPPLPPPPQTNPEATQAASPPTPPPVVPLIIVGTNVMNQEPASGNAASANAQPVMTVTNVVTKTNTVTLTQTNTVTLTNTLPAATPDNSNFNHKGALAVGAGLLIAAAGLITLAVSRRRNANQSSLITRSMRKD
jgi:hypothetical protein